MKRANKVIVVGYFAFYLVVSIIIFVSYLREIRTLRYTSALLSIILSIVVVTSIMYMRNKQDHRIKYMASAGLIIVTFLVAFAFDNYYMRFMAAIPFIANIISYDKKFYIIFGITNSAINIFSTYIKTYVTNIYSGEAIVDNWCATLAIVALMMVLY